MSNYIRQITINEPNLDLRYIYFDVLMIDGTTPAPDETGGQPEINITNTGWSSLNIGVLETVGYGRYRALLLDVNQLGVILSRYQGSNTLESFGESIEIVSSDRNINIFEDSDSPIIKSYLNLHEAEYYFSTRLKTDSWTESSVQDKIKSLIMATGDIDHLAFSGSKTSIDQLLEFPRDKSTIIPREIKEATCEIAIKYLEGYDPEIEIDNLHVSQDSFFLVKSYYDITIVQEAKRAGINSEKAWRLLKPFLRDPRLLKVIRYN